MPKKLLLLFSLFLSCAMMAWGQEFPAKPDSPVADFTNTLSADEKQRLEQKLIGFEDSTSNQISVVLIKSVGDYDISEYGTLLIRNWGIGQKSKNNGVLILVAINDRKVTIQTGYGLEGALTDAATQQIIQQDLKPNFKAGNYFAGLDAATDHVIQFVKGEYKAQPKAQRRTRNRGEGGGSSGIIIFIIVIVLILIFRNRGGGGGGRVIGSRGGASPFWWLLAGNMLGRSSRGGDWGGFSGGGSGWGGGDSGGGWGGFGGGSAGGGGSSGSW